MCDSCPRVGYRLRLSALLMHPGTPVGALPWRTLTVYAMLIVCPIPQMGPSKNIFEWTLLLTWAVCLTSTPYYRINELHTHPDMSDHRASRCLYNMLPWHCQCGLVASFWWLPSTSGYTNRPHSEKGKGWFAKCNSIIYTQPDTTS